MVGTISERSILSQGTSETEIANRDELTFYPEVDSLDLHGHGVDLTVVDSLIPIPDLADVEVPVFDVGPLDGQSHVIYDPSILEGQERGELVRPHHLMAKQKGRYSFYLFIQFSLKDLL